MIRILILLVTLNALFPTAGLACVSKTSANMSTVSITTSIGEAQGLTADNASHHPSATISVSSQMHCDDPMQVMDCDSGCCANCVSISIALTPSSSVLLSPMLASKPVSSSVNFYTRHTSPELQPPLI
jgi:hypothetical protein